ncbi:ribosomal L1 domain-containing protein CG13096-like [Cynara cardunculus var. scolymus]|uniref:ribosomal L1 domain-containing protein CG13096-like n=1 Tax=Cynara cardunculus var. scolymus TaxID=59895 RepID=UPI000D62C5EA|nr:ribosomal L1 domain-containing protein CG13096-like [Cynara cardunculus var. scolymus]
MLALRQPALVTPPSFTTNDRTQFHETREATNSLASALTRLEEMMVLQIHSVDQLSSICSQALAKEGEIRSNAAGPSAETSAPTTQDAKAEASRARAEADAEVVYNIPTSSEAAIAEDADVIRAEAHEDDDEEGDSPDLPDSNSDLDDDNDNDDEDDFTIQFQRPTTPTKEVALRDSASQGERREEESVP